MFDFSPISKAIAGGIVTGIVAILAHYGFNLVSPYTDALGVLATGLIGYVVGHAAVYLSPANRPKL